MVKLLRKRNDRYGRGHFRLVGIKEILEAMDDHQLHLKTRVGSWTTLLRFRSSNCQRRLVDKMQPPHIIHIYIYIHIVNLT